MSSLQLLFASGISLMYLLGTVVSWQYLALIGNFFLLFYCIDYYNGESVINSYASIWFIFQLLFHVYCKLLAYSSFQSLLDGW